MWHTEFESSGQVELLPVADHTLRTAHMRFGCMPRLLLVYASVTIASLCNMARLVLLADLW